MREAYRIPANQAHRALDDVKTLYALFTRLTDDLPMEVVLQLLYHQPTQPAIEKMPFGKHQGKPLSEVPVSYIRWLQENGAFDREENKQLKESLSKLVPGLN